jgi:NAD(P)H-dependent FMN reductase
MLVLAICGSVALSRRTRTLLEAGLAAAAACGADVETDLLDLHDTPLDICDGRPDAEYSAGTQAAVARVVAADAYLIGTPIYRAAYTGALKNLFDLTPREQLAGKVAGLLATGATDHHFLAVEHELRPVLSFFRCHTVPGVVYAAHRHFNPDGSLGEALAAAVRTLAQDTVALCRAIGGRAAGPDLI